MSDTLATPPVLGAQGVVAGNSSGNIARNLDAAVGAAPELRNDPGTAVSVASGGGNVPLKAQAVSQAKTNQSIATAHDATKQAGGIFGMIGHDLGDAIHAVGHAANVGLATVQQEYRYLHDVEAKHGAGAAFGEGLGILAGAVAGSVVEPGEGTVLGAEAAARLEGALTFKDSWAAAANPNYRDPHTGHLVSFGRDLASDLGANAGGAQRTVLSGVFDGLGDIFADPLGLVGKVVGRAKSVEGISSGLLSSRFTGLSLSPENIQQGYDHYGSVRQAFQKIADAEPAEIVRMFPKFKGVEAYLGDATTAEEVKDKFINLTAANDLMAADKLPTWSKLHTPFYELRNSARNAGTGPLSQIDGPVGFVARRAANNALLGPARWARRFEALPGTFRDPITNDLAGIKYDPANNNGMTDVMNMVRYSGSEDQAQIVGNALAYATPAQRIVVYKNSVMQMLLGLAGQHVPDLSVEDPASLDSYLGELADGRTRVKFKEMLDNLVNQANVEGVGTERVFGTYQGKNIAAPVDSAGVEHQGGILENQTGPLTIPDLVSARRMALDIHSARISRFTAGVDDFTYNHFTQGIFKPLILLSGGYAEHIAAAERVPNALKNGLRNEFRTLYDRAVLNLKLKGDATDRDGLLAHVYDVMPTSLRNKQDLGYMAEDWASRGGARATAAVRSGEVTIGETQPVEKQLNVARQLGASGGLGTKEGKDFARMSNADERFPKSWHSALREAANSDWASLAAKSYRNALEDGKSEAEASEFARTKVVQVMRLQDPNFLSNFVRQSWKMASSPDAWDATDSHAHAVVDLVKGLVHGEGEDGKNGVLHTDLLNSIANKRPPTMDEVKAIDGASRPAVVKGRIVVPDGTGSVQRIANWGFRKLINPFVDIVSRNQEYSLHYLRFRRDLQPAVDAGLISDDDALTRAQAQATQYVTRFVHNLHDRTQWTATLRNWAPFYFAQEQAYRRMGRLLAEDPGAFRRYQLMIAGVHNLSATVQDSNGNKYIALPGTGFLGKGVADAMGLHGLTVGSISPASFGGSFSSANVIFPLSQGFKPDLSPVVTVPASQLATMFTELGKNYSSFRPVANVVGSALQDVAGPEAIDSPVWEQLIPNTFVQRLVQATNADDRAFNSSVMQAYQLADYQQAKAEEAWVKDGRKGPEPQLIPPANAPAAERQAFVNKIRNMVRALYVARAITGMVSPVSASVEIQNFGFPAEINTAIAKAGSVSQGMVAFLADHPDAIPYTVSQSYVPSDTSPGTPSGFSLASSDPAMQWVTQNQAFVNKYGNAAMWLMPQLTDNKYDPTVYNEQIAQGLRVKDTPDQFLDSLYTAAGDNLYYNGLTIHENALTAAGNSSVAKNAEYNAWSQYVVKLQQQNPVWADSQFSAVKQTNAQQVIGKLTQIFDKGEAPPGVQSDLVQNLLENYYKAAADFATAGTGGTYSQQLSNQSAVNDAWLQYLDALAKSTPALKPVITTVFKNTLKKVVT